MVFFSVPNSLFSQSRPGGFLTLGRAVKAQGSAVQTHFLSLNWSLGVTAAAQRHLDGRKEGWGSFLLFSFRTTPAPNLRFALAEEAPLLVFLSFFSFLFF